jgi:hypothetical protein
MNRGFPSIDEFVHWDELLFHGGVYIGNPKGLSVQIWLLQEPALTPPLSGPIVALIFSGGTPLA